MSPRESLGWELGLLGLDPKPTVLLSPVLGQSHMPSFPHSKDGGEDYYDFKPQSLARPCGCIGRRQLRPFRPQQPMDQLVLSSWETWATDGHQPLGMQAAHNNGGQLQGWPLG